LSKLDLQYDLQNYTPASASPVEANLDRIEQHVNQETIERDGTVAMRAQLRLAGDPVSNLDAAPKQYVDQILPVGIIMMYGGVATPPGGRWAVCNGAEMESTVYPALFSILGNNYSPAGTPAGRFHLPNFTARFPMGGTPGSTGGYTDSHLAAHSHTMHHGHASFNTTAQSAQHSHGFSGSTGGQSASHYHSPGDYNYEGFAIWDSSGGGSFGGAPGGGLGVFGTTAYAATDHTHAFSGGTGGEPQSHVHGVNVPVHEGNTGAAGSTAANMNFPPYVGMTFIIRVN
jgi:microcystin-dependent protein